SLGALRDRRRRRVPGAIERLVIRNRIAKRASAPRPIAWIRRQTHARALNAARHDRDDTHPLRGMTALRVLIVDDEPLARQRLRHLLTDIPETEIIGECGDGTDAVGAIADLAPDVVLLDVQMREMGGFALVDAIGTDRMPPVVFVTAHDQFALRAFDVSAV